MTLSANHRAASKYRFDISGAVYVNGRENFWPRPFGSLNSGNMFSSSFVTFTSFQSVKYSGRSWFRTMLYSNFPYVSLFFRDLNFFIFGKCSFRYSAPAFNEFSDFWFDWRRVGYKKLSTGSALKSYRHKNRTVKMMTLTHEHLSADSLPSIQHHLSKRMQGKIFLDLFVSTQLTQLELESVVDHFHN